MRNIKFIVLALFAALTTGVVAQVQSFSAAEIKSGATKGAVSVSTPLNVVNKQMCKENNKSVKIDAIEGGSTASTVNDNYVQISATSDIAKLVLHATYNSSGSGKKMAFVYWGEGVTPSIDNVLSAELVTFVGYDGACDQNYAEVTLPTGVRTIRIYRQLKKFDGHGASSSNYGDGTTFFIADIDVTAGPAPKSNDATLKSLTYNGVSVPDFAPEKTHYDVELAAYITALPTITAETNDAKATFNITGPSAIPGTATIDVTAEDGETQKRYTIAFTRESSSPKVLTAVWDNMRGTAVIDNINRTITGAVTNGSSLTLAPTFTGRNISTWSPKDAQDFSAGSIEYTFTNNNSNESTTYSVTITEAPAVSSNAQLSDLSVAGYTINFSSDIYSYDVTVPASTTTPPTVTYTLSDPKSTAVMTTATGIPGVTFIVVTAEDDEIQSVYTVNFNIPVPSTSLSTHVPGIYESEDGYKGALRIIEGREYEVYYATTSTVDDGKTLAVAVVPQRKVDGITTNAQEKSCAAKDGWFKMNAGDKKSDFNPTDAVDEFEAGSYAIHKLMNGTGYEFHIRGYDQFCFYGTDAESDKSKGKYFQVIIDGKEQNVTPSKTASVRRFNIPAGEHVIKVIGVGESKNEFYGFSLRLTQSPYIRHLRGNDSTQVVYQKRSIPPVSYIVKYNSAPGVKTALEWKTEPATGIELTKFGKGSAFADTLQLSGQALCPTGLYKYEIVSSLNGVEVQRVAGTFNVATLIIAPSDTVLETYKDEALEVPLRFPYYAYDDNIRIQWENDHQPNGIIFIKSNDTLIIDGTPTEIGDFKYEVSAVGGNRIKGMIRVKELDLSNHPILYLYQNNIAYEKDGVYNYLKDRGKNLITRKCRPEARPIDQYRNYEWVIISEDADATNPEVLEVIRGGANLPILNMKAFSYTSGRLDWGEPDNGSVDTITNNGRNIFVEQDEHPIFKKLNKKRGDKIQVLSEVNKKGLMPINVTYAGTLCLATAYTRSIDDYYKDGELQTFLHEIPASMRGGKKYICLPIALSSSKNLTAEGKKLLDAAVEYLLSDDTFEQIPTLQITSFDIDGVRGEMKNNKIHFEIDLSLHKDLDIKAISPQITLASEYTHVTPASGKAVDFSTSMYKPVEYVVTDYINRRVYEVTVHTFSSEGLEDVYSIGEWVNIYDIYGRKITTTNENIFTMELPRGVYLIVNEQGKTTKILK